MRASLGGESSRRLETPAVRASGQWRSGARSVMRAIAPRRLLAGTSGAVGIGGGRTVGRRRRTRVYNEAVFRAVRQRQSDLGRHAASRDWRGGGSRAARGLALARVRACHRRRGAGRQRRRWPRTCNRRRAGPFNALVLGALLGEHTFRGPFSVSEPRGGVLKEGVGSEAGIGISEPW